MLKRCYYKFLPKFELGDAYVSVPQYLGNTLRTLTKIRYAHLHYGVNAYQAKYVPNDEMTKKRTKGHQIFG